MNAPTTIPRVQALPPTTTGSHNPFPADTHRRLETGCGNLNAEQITHRATKMTVVLKNILEHSCYTHGGLNE